MSRINRPTGLIRYDSLNGFAGKGKRFMRPRTYAYTLLASLGIFAMLLIASIKARPFNATVSRVGGSGFYSDATSVRNIYKVRFINKRNQTASVTIKLGQDTPSGYQLSGSGQTFTVDALGEMSRTCVVICPLENYRGSTDFDIQVHANPGDVQISRTVRFLGPNPQSIQLSKPQEP